MRADAGRNVEVWLSLFQQFPRILILSIKCRIVVDLHGKFIQNAKGENPKPMAVEGDANEEAQPPSPLERLSVLGWPHFPATVNPA